MKTRHAFALTAILMVTTGVGAANAATSIIDNFDSPSLTPEGNWPGDGTFLSIPQPGDVQGKPSVDLVGGNYYGYLAFQGGNSVDLDGSTGGGNKPAGELQSVDSLSLGKYKVSFEFSGNQNRSSFEQTTEVKIGNTLVATIVNPTDGYQLLTYYTATPVFGQVSFTDIGPSNQQGDLIDSISVTAVPEPATWAMFLVGFGAIGFAMRRPLRKVAIPFA